MSTTLQDLSSKSQGSEGGEGRKEGRGEKEDRKPNKTGHKSNILQINEAKSTCDQANSDNVPVTAKLVKEVLSILTSV